MKVKVINTLEDALRVIDEQNKEIDASNKSLKEKTDELNDLQTKYSTLSKELEVAKLSLVGDGEKSNIIKSEEDINLGDFAVTIF